MIAYLFAGERAIIDAKLVDVPVERICRIGNDGRIANTDSHQSGIGNSPIIWDVSHLLSIEKDTQPLAIGDPDEMVQAVSLDRTPFSDEKLAVSLTMAETCLSVVQGQVVRILRRIAP